MKKYFNAILLLFSFCCCNYKRTNSNINNESQKIIDFSKSDTICFNTNDINDNEEIEYLNSCYIEYSQMISDSIARQYGSGKLSELYNFDSSGKYLEYSIFGDTICIKLLFMVDKRIVQYRPRLFHGNDSIYFINLESIPKKEVQKYDGFVFNLLDIKLRYNGTNKEIKFVKRHIN